MVADDAPMTSRRAARLIFGASEDQVGVDPFTDAVSLLNQTLAKPAIPLWRGKSE